MIIRFQTVPRIILVVGTVTVVKTQKEDYSVNANFGGSATIVTNVSRVMSLNDGSLMPWIFVESKSGTQVIIAGCLLGVLIIIIYSSRIYRRIRNKRKQPKKLEPK